MDRWSILGIDPTKDLKQIKKAYAKQLKLHHPEDDPQGFLKLREAYEKIVEEVNHQEEDLIEEVENQEDIFSKEDGSFCEELEETVYEKDLTDDIMERIIVLYNDFFSRIDVKAWKRLLHDERLMNIEVRETLSLKVLRFLMDHYYLPNNVWVFLNEYFKWVYERVYWCEYFPEKFIDFVLDQVYCDWRLSYDCFTQYVECDYDAFIELRYAAYYAIQRGEEDVAFEYLKEAEKIFSEDADLTRMLGNHFINVGENQKARNYFTHLIQIHPNEIDGYLNRADLWMKDQEYKKAYDDYERVLQKDFNQPEALRGMAQCCIKFDEKEKALKLYQRAIKVLPYAIDIHICLYELSQELINTYSEKVQQDPTNLEYTYKLAKTYFDIEEFSKCCKMIRKVLKKPPLNLDMYILLIKAYIEDDAPDLALIYIDEALKKIPKEAQKEDHIDFLRGVAYFKNKKYDQAIQNLDRFVQKHPNHGEGLYYLAKAYERNHWTDQAIDTCTKAIEVNPNKWMYYSLRASMYYKQENYRQAVKDYERVVKHKYDSHEVWFEKGDCHLKLEEYEKAIDAFKEARDWTSHPKDQVYLCMAEALYHIGQFQEALDSINNCKKKKVSYYIILGNIYISQKNYNDANQAYKNAYKMDSNNEELLNLLINLSSKAGKYKETFEYVKKLYAIVPKNLWVHSYYVFVCIQIHEYNKAYKMIRDCECDIEGEEILDPYMSLYAGILFYENKLYKDAQIHLKKAIEYGIKGDAFSYLSMVYYEMGQMEKALEFAQKSLDENPNHIDYKLRYNGILKYKDKKKLFFFNRKPSSQKKWVATLPIAHKPLEEFEDFTIKIGEYNGK